jgi:hypothetical protein
MPVFVFTTFGAPVVSFARRQPEGTDKISNGQKIITVSLVSLMPMRNISEQGFFLVSFVFT